MRPQSEGDMRVRRAVEADFVGILEDALVAVRRWIEEAESIAGADRLPVDLGVLRSHPEHVVQRRDITEKLLDGTLDHAWFLYHLLPQVRAAGKQDQ